MWEKASGLAINKEGSERWGYHSPPEEHSGYKQDLLFRVISKHHTSLEMKVTESVLIEEVASDLYAYLNRKSEWAGSKLPWLSVTQPKETTQKAKNKGKK